MSLDGSAAAHFPASRVYCNDRLLATLQLADWRPHPDSKTLVDLPLRVAPEEALAEFELLGETPSSADGRAFLDKVFHDDPDAILHAGPHIPSDYTLQPPSFVRNQPGSPQRDFAAWLKRQWLALSRSFDTSEIFMPSRSSLIPLPHPFFVPGGRFRELYYWDSLWIVHGLLACDMRTSAMNVVRNLLHLVRQFGFVPNGNRVYYLNRSQPPVLAAAVDAIYEHLSDDPHAQINWLREAVPMIEREYRAFKEHRNALSHPHADPDYNELLSSLSIYKVATSTPRPESYSEDVHTAGGARSGPDAARLFRDLASGAESGWDFSTRWLGEPRGNLNTIRTSEVVPTCLNSLLLRTERLLAKFQRALGSACRCPTRSHVHQSRARRHDSAADARANAMAALMWDRSRALWMDWDGARESPGAVVSAAALLPVWAGAHIAAGWGQREAIRFVRTVTSASGLFAEGGLVATDTASEQQWDFPNSWPPLADLAVDALRRLEEDFPGCGAGSAAEELAMRTLRAMHRGWRAGGDMHEKYDARYADGASGGGGEYAPQDGFGWTNGVALKLMKQYHTQIAAARPGTWLS